MKLTKQQKVLRLRLIQLLFQAKSSHIGSCLSAIDIIDTIYNIKDRGDRFILSNGHAAAAYYVVLEKNNYLQNANLNELGVHPERNPKNDIHVSTGSLGQGLPIALGMALVKPETTVYCMISDGEAAEGSIWESLKVYQEQFPKNLKIIVNANGWGAYDPISSTQLKKKFRGFGLKVVNMNGHKQSKIKLLLLSTYNDPVIFFAKTNSEQLPFLKELNAHYHCMNEADYQLAFAILS